MKRKIIALILTTVMLAGILPVSAIAGHNDVWIDNTVDESQTQVKVTLEVEDPNTGNNMKYSIMDRMVPSSYSNGITADVSAAITEGVNAAMKMIEDKGFEFVDAIVGGAVPREYIKPTQDGLIDALDDCLTCFWVSSNTESWVFFG